MKTQDLTWFAYYKLFHLSFSKFKSHIYKLKSSQVIVSYHRHVHTLSQSFYNCYKQRVKGKVIPVQASETLRVASDWGSLFFKQSAHIWQEGCQPYTLAAFYAQEDSWYSYLLEAQVNPGL
jgi:hypothetical protein